MHFVPSFLPTLPKWSKILAPATWAQRQALYLLQLHGPDRPDSSLAGRREQFYWEMERRQRHRRFRKRRLSKQEIKLTGTFWSCKHRKTMSFLPDNETNISYTVTSSQTTVLSCWAGNIVIFYYIFTLGGPGRLIWGTYVLSTFIQ